MENYREMQRIGDFPGSLAVKNPSAYVDAGSIPGSGRSPGEGHGYCKKKKFFLKYTFKNS